MVNHSGLMLMAYNFMRSAMSASYVEVTVCTRSRALTTCSALRGTQRALLTDRINEAAVSHTLLVECTVAIAVRAGALGFIRTGALGASLGPFFFSTRY